MPETTEPLTNSTSERERQIAKIRERRLEAAKLAWMDHPPQPTWRDVDVLLSLLDSEAAGGEETPDQVWVELRTQHAFTVKPELYIETVEYLRKATVNAHYEDLMRATLLREESAATRMRDLCVEKVKARLAEVIARAEHAHYTELADLNPRRATLEEVQTDLESLTLEVQEKPDAQSNN